MFKQFIVIMKMVEFVLDRLYGIGNLKTFINGGTPKAKTILNV
jgi:hypothetical protein